MGKRRNKAKKHSRWRVVKKPLRPSLSLGRLPCEGNWPSLRGLRGFSRLREETVFIPHPPRKARPDIPLPRCSGPARDLPGRAARAGAGWGRAAGTAAGGCDIRPAAVQQRGQVAGHPRRIAALQGQHRSTLLRRQPHGCAALTAQNSAQERQYGALQKRPGHGSGQRGVCRAEVQPPRTAVRQLPHGGAERVQLGVQLQCAGRRGRGQGFRRQHQPQ